MKKIWLGIGAAVIVVLLLLQTRFTEYMVLWDSGYAMPGNDVKQMLMADIDELPEEMEVSFLPYEVLDKIFNRGLLYYLGEQKKTQINLSYPLYINDCAGIYFVKDAGTLFDVDFEQAAVYQGLRVTNQIAYNQGGDRADATEYLFAGITDGLVINLAPVEYEDRGEIRTIDTNSVIYFTEEYFTYCEPNDGIGQYQLCRNIASASTMKVGGVECSYHDLLIKLQVIFEKKAKPERVKPHKDKEEEEEEYPEQEVLEATEVAAGVVSNITAETSDETAASAPTKRASVSRPRKPSEPRPAPAKDNSTGGGKRPPQQRPPGTGTSTGSMGVRPDEMRPDKKPSDGGGDEIISDPVAIGYVKPEVTITDARSGVYRLMLDVKVDDPARRLHPQRKVQFEFYEQHLDGKETLAYRSFTGGTGTVTAGNGSIKPGTTYRVYAYFTYFDEYDNIVVEPIYDGTLTTKAFETLGAINLADVNIDTYYDNCVIVPGVHYTEDSDPEAVYGINSLGGFKIVIKGDGNDYSGTTMVDANNLRIFKNGNKATVTSAKDLYPKSHYTYELIAEDYFGRKLTVTNNTGAFDTCKSRPVGNLELKKNVIGDIQLHVNLFDPDLTAVKGGDGNYEVYLVLAKEKFAANITNEQIKEMSTNDDDEDGVRKQDVHKFLPTEYTIEADGSMKIDMDVQMASLLLNHKYFAYLYCDYDLGNLKGTQVFGEIAQFSFTSASLNSLGRIYIKTDISNINADSAVIAYTLDTGRTNDTLERLLSSIRFDIVRGNGEEAVSDSFIQFDAKAMAAFTGYIKGEQLTAANIAAITGKYGDTYAGLDVTVSGGDLTAIPGTIMMGQDYFKDTQALRSKTDYTIVPKIMAEYDGVEYPMDVTLTMDTFKTWKKPAYVKMQKELLAAEHLIFDVRIFDPDEGVGTPEEGSIIGNSGHKVIMNVYQTNGRFVTAQRIEKNTVDENGNETYVHVDIPGVDIDRDFRIIFFAEEYNEAYTNATYYANYMIGEFYIRDAVKISGDIKLRELKAVTGDDSRLQADVKVTIQDADQLLSNPKTPFYISVAKDGVLVTDTAGLDGTYPKDGKWQAATTDYMTLKKFKTEEGITPDADDDDSKLAWLRYLDKSYYTDKGKHKYLLSLYTIINDQTLVMDTLEFTTEDVIEPIDDEYDFVWKTRCFPNKRYAVTRDLKLQATKTYAMPVGYRTMASSDGSALSADDKKKAAAGTIGAITPRQVTGNFNGQIDFQGFELNYNADHRTPYIFSNIGANAELMNVVFNFGYDNQDMSTGTKPAVITQWYDGGILSHRNYGHIHDFEMNFTGGVYMNNQYFGLLCRYNTISGLIENFAVGNLPDEEDMGFAANYMCGMIASENWGTVRNGYLFGEDIEADTQQWSRAGDIYVGGITGYNHYQGRINRVYSLITVSVAGPKRHQNYPSNQTKNSRYGALVGYEVGRTENSFIIGECYYSDEPSEVNTGIGPAIGTNTSRTSRVYYWNAKGRDYPSFTYQRRVGLATLYDYGWHSQLLGSQFKTSNVEVGYYPHVKLSSELPAQEYIPLPERTKLPNIDLMSSELMYYQKKDGTMETEADPKLQEYARIKFRFYNPKNAEITGIAIEHLICELDKTEGKVVMEDGYTTLEAVVSVAPNGQYLSSYAIQSVSYSNNGKAATQKFDPMPQLLVDFYRPVNDENEWIEYVVKKPKENARLQNNLDFKDYKKNEMRVYNVAYQGKLDGNDKTIRNIEITGAGHAYLFQKLDVMAVVENLYIETVSIRGKDVGEYWTDLIQSNYGRISNVHVNHIKLRGYGNIGGLVGYSYEGSSIQDSSVSDVVIEYAEPTRCTSDGFIGGLVGRTEQTNIQNCYVRKLDLTAMDMNACQGAGGLIGYVGSSYIDGAYATGYMSVRGSNVGGIVGYQYFSAETSALNNVLAKVDITGYQNYVGGIAGYFRFYTGLNSTNNLGGVAYGNVFINNPQASGVSYAIGGLQGTRPVLHGSEVQSYNGILVWKDNYPTTRNDPILTEDEVKTPGSYTGGVPRLNIKHYLYDEVEDGYMPRLCYYDDDTRLLPGQDDRDDDRNLFNGIGECDIYVKNVALDTNNQRIMVSYTSKDDKYIVTDIKVGEKERNNNLVLTGDPNIDKGTIFVQYALEQDQEHWLDSYWISEVTYAEADSSRKAVPGTERTSQLLKNPVRIPLTLYKNIPDATTWERVMKDNGDKYENFRITKDIGFGAGCNQVDTRLGRLIGEDAVGAATSIVGLKLYSNNLVYRLNSEMGNLKFKNCSISSKGITYSGFVGSAYGRVHDMSFENITINELNNNIYQIGSIGQLMSGTIEDVTLNNVTVSDSTNKATGQQRLGALVGYVRSASVVKNVKGTTLNVKGYQNVGGVIGYVNYSQINDISVEDVKVTGNGGGSYVGGIVGLSETGWSYNPANLSVKGTPNYDDDGWVTSSTSVISNASGQYVGGIAGYMQGASQKNYKVEGIVVRGTNTRIGGAVGYAYSLDGATVKDVLIENSEANTTREYDDVGGILGLVAGGLSNGTATNVLINVQNGRHVGAVLGYRNSGGQLANCVAVDCAVLATRGKKSTAANAADSSVWDVGGLTGRADNRVYNCGVINTNVIAPGYGNVGGVVGYMNHQLDRCYYYATPRNAASDPAALFDSTLTYYSSTESVKPSALEAVKKKNSFVVLGSSHVGGIIGVQNSNQTAICYSNANVIAQRYNGASGVNAGGIVGYYNTAYSLNAQKKHVNSTASVNRSYFAGTVEAYDRAGGAIGLATLTTSTVADANINIHKAMGGRYDGKSKYKAATGGEGLVIPASGALNETSYTYENLILAKSVTATGGTAYAFCGSQDGYEGLADTSGTNQSPVYKARRSFLWSEMTVKGTALYQMNSVTSTGVTIYTTSDAAIPENNSGLKANGVSGTRFARWRGDSAHNGSSYGSQNGANVRLVDGNDFADINMWKAMNWHTAGTGNPRGIFSYLFNIGTVTDDTYKGLTGVGSVSVKMGATTKALNSSEMYRAKYLPLMRINTNDQTLDETSLKQQCKYGAILPWPTGSVLDAYYASDIPDSYVAVNPADADRINVEFSQDYVDNEGFFTISYGGQQIGDTIQIDRRVYTFRYDYGRNVTVQACYADGSAQETVNCYAAQLERHVMTWDKEYYYIPKEQTGIVHGTGSAVSGAATGTIKGDYITVYNGHALRRDGAVIDVANGSQIRSVADMAEGLELVADVTPLQRYDSGGMIVETYNRFTDIVGSNLVMRDTQILRAANGLEGFIDGAMENIKDSVVLFKKDGKDHEIILGRDGIMVNLFGTDLAAPKDFRSSGIVYMTNNLNCSAPFILVEYGVRGSMVGYNYMTGEYLFNLYESNENIIDFAKRYFNGDKSMYADAYLGYASNKALIDMAGNADRLDKLVVGNSTRTDVDGNSTGEDTVPARDDGKRAGLDQDRTDGNGESAIGFVAGHEQAEGGVQDSTLLAGSQSGDEFGSSAEVNLKETQAVSEAVIGEEPEDGYNTVEGDSEMQGSSTAHEKGVFDEADTGKSDGDGLGEGKGFKSTEQIEAEKAEADTSTEVPADGRNEEYEQTEGLYKPAAGKKDDAENQEEITDPEAETAEADETEAAESEDGNKAIGTNKTDAEADNKGSDKKKSEDEHSKREDLNGKKVVQSTAGTAVAVGTAGDVNEENRMPANNIASGKTSGLHQEDSDKKNEEIVTEKAESKLIMVYNQATGTFEIVDMRQFMTSDIYRSENAKLQIADLGAYALDAGFAEKQEEKKRADGLLLYIALAMTICAGTAAILRFRKKNKL